MNKAKVIPVFFTIDNNYAPYLGVALTSMIANASKDYRYRVIVINENLSDANKDKLKKLENDNFEIVFSCIKESLEAITDRVENRLRCDYFTLTIYYRLFIADMFPEYDKGIYIDSDVVIPGDISQLYNVDLKDNIIGACQDRSVENIWEITNYMENAVGVKSKEYVNSGMLLMNLKVMREKQFSSNFLRLLEKYHFDCIAPDQDYINAMCNGKILYLDYRWDTMPIKDGEKLDNPKIIHYNLFGKPWNYDNVMYEDYFWEYARNSPYYEEILSHKNNYSLEEKQADKDHLDMIIQKASDLTLALITFKNVTESGEKVRI